MKSALRRRIQEASRAALASGALQPLTARVEALADRGFDFLVHVLDPRVNKPRAQERPGHDPLADPEAALLVGEVSPTHRLMLNKYNVLAEHALIVTRAAEDQLAPLTLDDFDAVRRCLQQLDGLVFFNGGAIAGASQRHKHFQLVPLPLAGGTRRLPLDPAHDRQLPFRHAYGRFAHALPEPEDWLGAWRALQRALGLRDGGAFNLLATREWLMVVPRPRETCAGIGVNALGFVGVMLVHDEGQLATLRREGPVRVLQGLTQA